MDDQAARDLRVDEATATETADPVVAAYLVRIVLRAPRGTDAPGLAAIETAIVNGVGWGYSTRVSAERVDR